MKKRINDKNWKFDYDIAYDKRSLKDKIKQFLKKYFGNNRDALIAYNWGAGNTKKWLKKGGNFKELPKETRNYVEKILGVND